MDTAVSVYYSGQMLRIYLFGQLRVTFHGEPYPLTMRPKAYPLWAYLLLNREQEIDRSHLAYNLWPDESEKEAKTNLRRHLHYLRQALPANEPWILTNNRMVQWNPESSFWLDVAEFEQLAQTKSQLEQTAALYTGDLLENLYDDWLYYDRERLRDLNFSVLSRLAQQQRVQAQLAEARQTVQHILRLDPLREDTVRQLMVLQFEVGNRSGAIAEYEHFSRLLRNELGVEPMPDTVTLYEKIARNELPISRQPVTMPVEKESRQQLPFVGRLDELTQLESWWYRATQGHGQFLFMAGEAGIGKTRLVGKFTQVVEKQNGRFLIGQTSFTEPMPYQAVMTALESNLHLLANLNISPLWMSALLPVLPGLRSKLPELETAVSLAPEQEKERLFEAVYRCLRGLAQTRPVLMVLEDLHWASPATTAMLDYLAHRIQETQILLVATYREEETSRSHPLRQLRRQLQRSKRAIHITVPRLSIENVAQIVDKVKVANSLEDGVVEWLYQRSDGNPLFIQELVYEWMDLPQDSWRTHIPDNLRDIIRDRLKRLPEEARTLVEITAVVGSAFDVELVREACGWQESHILDALNILQDRYLIREAGRGDQSDFAFTHQLVQETVYEDIPPLTRQRRHQRVAQILEDIYPARLAELAGTLAYHYDAGGLSETAVPYYVQGAKQALAVYADEEALEFIERGLVLADAPQTQINLLLLRQNITFRQGHWDKSEKDLAQLAQLAADKQEMKLRILRRWIQLQHAQGNQEAEAVTIAKFQTLVSQNGDSYWQAEEWRVRADYDSRRGDYEQAQGLYQEALALYQELGDAAGSAQCLCALAEIATHRSEFEQVVVLVSQAQQFAEAADNQLLAVEAIHAGANAAFVRQNYEHSETLSQNGLAICKRIGYREGQAGFHKLLGAIYSRRFDVPAARSHYEQAGRLYKSLGKRQGEAAVLMNMGVLNVRLGHHRAGISAFAQAEQLFAEMDDLRGQTLGAINLTAAALYEKEFVIAREAAVRSVLLAKQMGSIHLQADALGNLGEVERELEELETAVLHMKAGIALRRSLAGQPVNLVSDMRELVTTQLRLGDVMGAKETAVDLLTVFDADRDAMLQPHHTLWAAAEAFRAAGEVEQADSLLHQAYTALQEQAQVIPDEASQAAFWQRPLNQEIVAAFQHLNPSN